MAPPLRSLSRPPPHISSSGSAITQSRQSHTRYLASCRRAILHTPAPVNFGTFRLICIPTSGGSEVSQLYISTGAGICLPSWADYVHQSSTDKYLAMAPLSNISADPAYPNKHRSPRLDMGNRNGASMTHNGVIQPIILGMDRVWRNSQVPLQKTDRQPYMEFIFLGYVLPAVRYPVKCRQ